MARVHWVMVLFFSFFCMRWRQGDAAEANETYYIGFLTPLSNPSADSPIPVRLAQQWQSAFVVALEVLNSEDRSYKLAYISADTACDWMAMQSATSILEQNKIIGVVGPACSGAAVSASNFMKGVPVVSFAATAESLSDRELFPNLYRTVYSDDHQALAVKASIDKLNMTNVTIISTKGYYELRLATSIQKLAGSRILQKVELGRGSNFTVDMIQLEQILNTIRPNDFVILVVPPLVAEEIWITAAEMDKTKFPWWYFGVDGTTTFIPSMQGDGLTFAYEFQGEIGLTPFGSDHSICSKFYNYWARESYPGFPSMDLRDTRSYVPFILDTVTMLFYIIDELQAAGMEVNSSNVMAALNGSGPGAPNFKGCSGPVSIDPRTGSRRVSAQEPAVYGLVSLVEGTWQLKGQIKNGKFEALQALIRPGTFSQHRQYNESSTTSPQAKRKYGVIVAGIVTFSSTAFILLIIVAILHYRRHHINPNSFFHFKN